VTCQYFFQGFAGSFEALVYFLGAFCFEISKSLKNFKAFLDKSFFEISKQKSSYRKKLSKFAKSTKKTLNEKFQTILNPIENHTEILLPHICIKRLRKTCHINISY
jgi:hypothetical protein